MKDFVHAMNATNLTPDGRRSFLDAYRRRMEEQVTHPEFKYKLTYRQLLEVQTRLVGRYLAGEIDVYPTFGTR
jgi:CRISPR/Cas system-associated endonuclease Cas1